MVKKPSFKLIADGNIDITKKISKNLIFLNYEDKEGNESDEISFLLHGLFSKKPFGSKLELHLGWGDKLFLCGKFTIQTFKKDYFAKTTEVRATAVNFSTPQKILKSRLWENTTLGDIAKKIATENSLNYSIDKESADVEIKSYIQNNQNDFAFLRLVGYKFGSLVVIKNDTIIIKKKSTNIKTAADVVALTISEIPSFNVKIKELNSLEVVEANRNVYDAVTLEWQDINSGKTKIIKVGDGSQIFKMKIPQPKSEFEAFKQGEAKLSELQRGGITGYLEMEGRELRAGGKLTIEDLKQTFNIKSVSHTYDTSSYLIAVEIEG